MIRPGVGAVISFGVNGRLAGWPLLVFVVGLLLTAVLVVRRVEGALLGGCPHASHARRGALQRDPCRRYLAIVR